MNPNDKAELEARMIETLEAIKDAQERLHARALWQLAGANPDFEPMGVDTMRDMAMSSAATWHGQIALHLAAANAEPPPPLSVSEGIPTVPSLMAVWNHALRLII